MHAEGYQDLEFEINEEDIIDDEGLAFFAKIRDQHLDEEEFDKDSGAFETDKEEEKE